MLLPRRIKHCRACGTAVEYRIPSDDNRERAVCNDCGTVHYENPLNVVVVGQVHFFYRARLLDTDFSPGLETSETRLFLEEEVPWEQLAFRTVRETLHRYFDDRRRGAFGMHFADIV